MTSRMRKAREHSGSDVPAGLADSSRNNSIAFVFLRLRLDGAVLEPVAEAAAFLFWTMPRVMRFGGERGFWGGEWSSVLVAEEEDLDADCCGVGAVSLVGEELCLEDEERWSGVAG